MNQEKNFLGDTPSHVTLVLGVLVGVVGTIVVTYLFGSAPSSASKNNQPTANIAQVNNQPTAQVNPTALPLADVKITGDEYVRGDKNAPIEMIEYSDFECPFCFRHSATIDQVLQEYAGKVKFTYRHFPLNSIHPNAQKAAESSECAGEQGKFWEMHDELFALAAEGGLNINAYKQTAKQLGLNVSKFDECLDSGKMEGKVLAQAQEGAQYGVNGTPATFINGTMVSGAVPFEQIKAIIDAQLADTK